MKKIMISKKELKHAFRLVEEKKAKKISLVFPENSQDKLSKIAPLLQELVDDCIMENVEVSVENIPYCFLVGLERYIKEVKDPRKEKPEKCRDCKHFAKCSGVWKSYLKKNSESEIVPVNGKKIITDNERCFIEILSNKKTASTREIIEAKNAPKFRGLCAHCVGSDDVILTGNSLVEKGIVEKKFTENGYEWSLSKRGFDGL